MQLVVGGEADCPHQYAACFLPGEMNKLLGNVGGLRIYSATAYAKCGAPEPPLIRPPDGGPDGGPVSGH